MSTLNAGQIAHEAGRARADLIGLHYLEIQDDLHRARSITAGARVTGGTDDQDDGDVRRAEIRLGICAGVLAWMQTHSIELYDGRDLTQAETA